MANQAQPRSVTYRFNALSYRMVYIFDGLYAIEMKTAGAHGALPAVMMGFRGDFLYFTSQVSLVLRIMSRRFFQFFLAFTSST